MRRECGEREVILKDISSSSFYCTTVANVPNELQSYWLIVLPLDFPDLTASLLLWGPSGQRWRCLWTFLFSNVPTFDTSRLQEILAAKVELHGREMADEFCLKMPDFHVTFRDLLHTVNLRHGTDGFTSLRRKACWEFFCPEKSNGFGRVWTRELGYLLWLRWIIQTWVSNFT